MADVHNKATRSYNMSRIRSKNTKPEILVRKYLHANGFRFRIYSKSLPGKPDIILAKYQTIILIQGCFWHGHPNCKDFKLPKTRTEYWRDKIANNIKKDQHNLTLLEGQNWQVITIWACQLEGCQKDDTLSNIFSHLTKKGKLL